MPDAMNLKTGARSDEVMTKPDNPRGARSNPGICITEHLLRDWMADQLDETACVSSSARSTVHGKPTGAQILVGAGA